MARINEARKFLRFIENVMDPEYTPDPEAVQASLDDVYSSEAPSTETQSVTSSSETPAAVTVVTANGTSVAVTEGMIKSNADVNQLANGGNLNDIVARRTSLSWNAPQGIKDPVTGNMLESSSAETPDPFFGDDIDPEEGVDVTGVFSTDSGTEFGFEGTAKTSGGEFEISSVETGDPEEYTEDKETSEEDTDPLGMKASENPIAVNDPIAEALALSRKIKECASLTGKVSDAAKPAISPKATNSLNNSKKVVSQPENTNASDKE